jgi:hypothetical protein
MCNLCIYMPLNPLYSCCKLINNIYNFFVTCLLLLLFARQILLYFITVFKLFAPCLTSLRCLRPLFLPFSSPSSPSFLLLIQQLLPLLLILCHFLSYISYKTHCLSSYNYSLFLLCLYINLILFVNICDFK